MTSNKPSSRRRITIRGQEVSEQDWRGILAVLTTVGYFLLLLISILKIDFTELLIVLGLLSTPEMLVLNWYFRAKEDSK